MLSVNFRGSSGLGKGFMNAANLEWGGKMQDDLVDAVEWAVTEGIADADRVAVLGASYGGYAVLAGLTMTPDVFSCGVDLVGPSNLITMVETIPPYWKPAIEMEATRVGDSRTEEGRALLTERSPLTHVDRIVKPLLIGHGANDARVKRAESDQIVGAMKEKGIPVIYLLYPDEGHGFGRPENDISFTAVAEAFLAEHLGGRFEPVGGDFEGSSIEVLLQASSRSQVLRRRSGRRPSGSDVVVYGVPRSAAMVTPVEGKRRLKEKTVPPALRAAAQISASTTDTRVEGLHIMSPVITMVLSRE